MFLHRFRKQLVTILHFSVFIFIIQFIVFADLATCRENILQNSGFEEWNNGTSFTSPANNAPTVDGWSVYRMSNPDLTISRETEIISAASSRYSAKISVSGSSGTHLIDFFQPIPDRDSYKGKTLIFSAKLKCSSLDSCQVLINDDTETITSRLNKKTGWQTLTCKKTVPYSDLTYLNAAIRIISGNPTTVYIDDCKLTAETPCFPIIGKIKHYFYSNSITANIAKKYHNLNRSTLFSFDILFCMIILAIFLRIFHTKNPLVYQVQLSTFGLILTLWLWANSWEDYSVAYSLWYGITFFLTFTFSKSIRVVILCGLYGYSVYYFRGKLGSGWDSFLYVGTMQIQFIRSIDIVTTDINPQKTFLSRLLTFASYAGVPVNVNSLYFTRFKDWNLHLESFNGIPALKEKYAVLVKKIMWIILSVIILLYQDQMVQTLCQFLTIDNTLIVRFFHIVLSLLAWWPLINNLLFLGTDLIGTPGIEISNMPILTTSPIDYWRRQQLGVATFFREKIYDNAWGESERSRYRNLFYTFVLIGLWHAMTYQWAVWGVMWGLLMLLNRYYRQKIKRYVMPCFSKIPWVYSIVCWMLTFFMLVFFQMIIDRDPNLPFILTFI